jgi:hypothetical protein
MKLEFFSRILEKNTQKSNFVEILPLGTEFHADRWPDVMKNSRFTQICEHA